MVITGRDWPRGRFYHGPGLASRSFLFIFYTPASPDGHAGVVDDVVGCLVLSDHAGVVDVVVVVGCLVLSDHAGVVGVVVVVVGVTRGLPRGWLCPVGHCCWVGFRFPCPDFNFAEKTRE